MHDLYPRACVCDDSQSVSLHKDFQELGSALYHSAANYTTLDYGDLLLSPAWRLLGPLEAINGALMSGVSAATVFAVVQRLVLARFEDLRS